jgi:hypothetical protein
MACTFSLCGVPSGLVVGALKVFTGRGDLIFELFFLPDTLINNYQNKRNESMTISKFILL